MAIHLVVLMCVLNHSGYVGSRMVMSLYALSLGADQFSIGIIMSLYALCPMLLAISAGKLVDRVGPRLPMLAGTIGLSASAIGVIIGTFAAAVFAIRIQLPQRSRRSHETVNG